jgi:hypothetical protein
MAHSKAPRGTPKQGFFVPLFEFAPSAAQAAALMALIQRSLNAIGIRRKLVDFRL